MIDSAFKRIKGILIDPHHAYDVDTLHKSRLLATFLVVMIVIFLCLDVVNVLFTPDYIVPWYGYIFLVSAYVLNRIKYYSIGAYLVVYMFPAVIFAWILTGTASSPIVILGFLVLGLIVANILLSPRSVVVLALADMTGILVMPFIAPDQFPDNNTITYPLAMIAIGAALLTISMRNRDRVEADRQEILRKSEEKYRLVSSVISDYTFANFRNEKGEFALDWVAGAFEQISGYTFEEFNARGGWVTTVHPDDLEQDARDMDLLFNNHQVVSELRTMYKDGSVRWVRSYAHPLWDTQKNQLIGIYGAVQDITDQKRIEQEREALILELEKKNVELEQFTYTVSHDLKAPVITIKGFLGYLAEDALAGNIERLQADIHRIGEATDKMHRLLDDLLELSRIGRLMNAPEPVNCSDLVRDAIELIQGNMMGKDVNIVVADELPVVYGDRQRLLQVVQNLLDNAVKFMGNQPRPQIEIGVYRQQGDRLVTLFIKDNGIGIAPQLHDRVFGLFNRLDPKIAGTGVGLALVKRIVEFHGGSIRVQSETGEGAAFYFSLPQPPDTGV